MLVAITKQAAAAVRFGAPTSFANTPLPDDAALDAAANGPLSPAGGLTATLDPCVPLELAKQASGGTYVNIDNYSAPLRVVASDQPLRPVLPDASLAPRTDPDAVTLRAVFATGLPIPTDFVPTGGTDKEAVFFQPGYVSPDGRYRGRLYEAWKLDYNPAFDLALPEGASNRRFQARWGGRIVGADTNPGHYQQWQFSGYRYQTPGDPDSTWQSKMWGVTAAGLPLVQQEISAEDCARERIEHSIGIQLRYSKTAFRWPAQRKDGTQTTWQVEQGMRVRFPPGSVAPAGLNRFAVMVFNCLRDFGGVIDDTTGVGVSGTGGLAVRCDPLGADRAHELFEGVPGYRVLRDLPWADLQVLATGSDTTPNL